MAKLVRSPSYPTHGCFPFGTPYPPLSVKRAERFEWKKPNICLPLNVRSSGRVFMNDSRSFTLEAPGSST